MDFGSFLRDRMKEMNISQKDLAARIGCSRRTVYCWEYNVKRPMHAARISRLADTLKIPAGDIIRMLSQDEESAEAAKE